MDTKGIYPTSLHDIMSSLNFITQTGGRKILGQYTQTGSVEEFLLGDEAKSRKSQKDHRNKSPNNEGASKDRESDDFDAWVISKAAKRVLNIDLAEKEVHFLDHQIR